MDGRIRSRWTAFSRTCRFPATLFSSVFINSGGPERCRPPENAAGGRHFPGPADFQQRVFPSCFRAYRLCFRLVFALFAGRMEKENFGSLVEPKRTYGRIVSVKGSGGGKTDGLL